MRRTISKSIVLALGFSLVSAQPAHAYIDPNTGGMLFQILAVLFAFLTSTLLVFSSRLRMAFARVARFLRGLSKR